MSIEGLVVLGIIYFVYQVISKAAEQARAQEQKQRQPGAPTGSRTRALSLETILQEMEKVRAAQTAPSERQGRMMGAGGSPMRQASPRLKPAPQDERGPLGRRSRVSLPSAEEVEVRESLEVEPVVASLEGPFQRAERAVLDSDDEAEEVIQRRLAEAAARNREHRDADHDDFHERVMRSRPQAQQAHEARAANFRNAVIWREILGPPRALEEWT